MNTDPKKAWEAYCTAELELLAPIFAEHGIALDAEQPHIAGERYLMQAVTTTSGRKLILVGKKDGLKVIIKATRDAGGKKEIEHERRCREILAHIDFAGEIFNTPKEVARITAQGFLITVTEFIEQVSSFTERPLEEQFAFALSAFKGQESAHATTWNHRRLIGSIFEIRTAASYLHAFMKFRANIEASGLDIDRLLPLLDQAETALREHSETIEQYTGFLTHTDFVPHNIRIRNNTIYLLDHSSLTFGNKYEGWARFLNFMTLYNPALEDALVEYVQNNRTKEESVSLRMMRIYRLGEIIWYYVQATEKSAGDLRALNAARITFWSDVLKNILQDKKVPEEVRLAYIATRDSLRSEDEKKRQKGLH